MELSNKTVMVLGGAGLVGQAICRQVLQEDIKRLIVTSLRQSEAEECVTRLKRIFPNKPCDYVALSGDIFAPLDLKDTEREARVSERATRVRLRNDLLSPLNEAILKKTTLYAWCATYLPDILVDCVNTATGMAYTDVYRAATQLETNISHNSSTDDVAAAADKLILSMPIPQLIRHVQILWESMCRAKTSLYLKIGTSGTGGMGLNIPYTHSEPKTAQLLLSKSAVAGAHSLLLFLMARTPGGPIVKELKPAAFIAWKKIGHGPILHRGKPLRLEDCAPAAAQDVSQGVRPTAPQYVIDTSGETRFLEAPFIDTGENGMWSRGEFELVTDQAQMEFITPEEIAQTAAWEIKGRNTGHEIVAALDNSTLSPSYRAGYMRQNALHQLEELEKKTGIDSVTFELAGPTTSKLLYEAHLLSLLFPTCEDVLTANPSVISKDAQELISQNTELRARIISVGIPILMPEGQKILCGSMVHIPSEQQRTQHPQPTAEIVDQWAKDGWVDLRPQNWKKWQTRIQNILKDIQTQDCSDSSSFVVRTQSYWEATTNGQHPIRMSKIVSWIYKNEFQGSRMKV